MSNEFGIAVKDSGDSPVLVAKGEIDVATAPALRDRLYELCATGRIVVVDLREVSFLDSSALGVLVGARRRCRESGGDLRLVIDTPRVRRLFDITGLNTVFDIVDGTGDVDD